MALIDNSKWKPVPIDVEGDFEGLIGIEEISDYNIETFRPSPPSLKMKEKKKKKKAKKISENKVVTTPAKGNVFIEEVVDDIKETDYYHWDNICVPKEISRALLEKGFTEPTEIQRLTIPPALKGRKDILGAAETGSGKTLAFAIPVIYGIMKNVDAEKKVSESVENTNNRLWALVLTPTRELAIQIKNHIETALKYTPLKVAVVVGGMSAEKQSRVLKSRPHILVATPGRLWDLIQNSNEPHLSDIEHIQYLVIDETDRMVETNHFPELHALIEKLNSVPEKVKRRQYFVFSATLSLVHQIPSYVQSKKRRRKAKELKPSQKLDSFVKLLGMTDPKIVDITQKTGTASTLIETKIVTSFEEKDFYLYYLLSVHPGRTLIFCNSISCVRRLASLLNALNLKPLPIHANMQQRQRLKNLDRFKTDSRGLLLATDVAARGLDIPLIEHVIHYQVPRTSETYIHRSGRTARSQNKGLTVLLIEPNEMKHYIKICTTLEREKDVPDFPIDFMVLKEAKTRVKLAREIDQINLGLKKERSQIGWIEKSAEEMDLILDEDQLPSKSDDSEIAQKKRRLEIAKKRLNELLSKSFASKSPATEVLNQEKLKKKIKIIKKKKRIF